MINIKNKMIAIFMGYKFAGDGKTMHYNITKPNEAHWFCGSWDLDDHILQIAGHFNYHQSWDELHPVLEKIAQTDLGPAFSGYAVDYSLSNGQCSIYMYDTSYTTQTKEIANFESDKDITATWLAVVEFIRWYNENVTK